MEPQRPLPRLDHEAAAERRQRLLDVGCGRAELLARLPPSFREVHGIDTDPSMRGFVKHPRVAREPVVAQFPVRDPESTYDGIRGWFATELPGARLRRRIGFRYTAEWTKPSI